MKIQFLQDSEKSVYGIKKDSAAGNQFLLNWKSTGLSQYVVVFGDSKAAVNWCEEKNRAAAGAALADCLGQLVETKQQALPTAGVTCYWVTHNDIKRDGGLKIREIPGTYAVYGAEHTADGLTVYIPDVQALSSSLFTMALDVFITASPHYVEKGLFKKHREYSGFHCVTVTKPYPNMVGGILTYTVDQFCFAFPDSVVKAGGSFFVQMAENDVLTFRSTMPGIQIK